MGFSAVSHSRLYEGVAAQIRALILDGRLAPGDKLPPLRELCDRFQVSRSSVRDAIRMLELMGLLRSRQGGGTVVQKISAELLTVPLSSLLLPESGMVAELLEVRSMLEPDIAARAAERITPAEIEALEQVLKRQRAKMLKRESTVQEDTEFHYALAVASRNSVVRKVVDLLMDLLRENRMRSLQVAGRLRRSYSGHRRILRAIRQRDPRGAEAAMVDHLRTIEALLVKRR
jgi:GntR family transcriptional repressor for pyruvate dehydrogenase complex